MGMRKRKSCARKARVVSAVKGTPNVIVFCAHGCGTSYTTLPRDVDKLQWNATLRKLNAHESQRCPKNGNRTRRPRRYSKIRKSCTANPSVPGSIVAGSSSKKKQSNKRQTCVNCSVVSNTAKAAQNNICTVLSRALEKRELDNRLKEEAVILENPALEDATVTGVYWTQPTETFTKVVNTAAMYNSERKRRLQEPIWLQKWRNFQATKFCRTVFPEFVRKLEQMRACNIQGVLWKQRSEHTTSVISKQTQDVISENEQIASVSSLPEKFGRIDTPDVLTLRKIKWGLGEQVYVYSETDGGRRLGHIVGIGGQGGSSVLIQFFAADGTLRQQLHESQGVPDGKKYRACKFDSRSKISDFTIQQRACSYDNDNNNLSANLAGIPGPKILPLTCDELLLELDNADIGILDEAAIDLSDINVDLDKFLESSVSPSFDDYSCENVFDGCISEDETEYQDQNQEHFLTSKDMSMIGMGEVSVSEIDLNSNTENNWNCGSLISEVDCGSDVHNTWTKNPTAAWRDTSDYADYKEVELPFIHN